jgi:hypothetical protein
MGPRSNACDAKERSFLTLLGIELRSLGMNTSSQSLFIVCSLGPSLQQYVGYAEIQINSHKCKI